MWKPANWSPCSCVTSPHNNDLRGFWPRLSHQCRALGRYEPSCALRCWHGEPQSHQIYYCRYLESRMKVGTMPAAEEKPVFPVESQLEQPCTLPRQACGRTSTCPPRTPTS